MGVASVFIAIRRWNWRNSLRIVSIEGYDPPYLPQFYGPRAVQEPRCRPGSAEVTAVFGWLRGYCVEIDGVQIGTEGSGRSYTDNIDVPGRVILSG